MSQEEEERETEPSDGLNSPLHVTEDEVSPNGQGSGENLELVEWVDVGVKPPPTRSERAIKDLEDRVRRRRAEGG